MIRIGWNSILSDPIMNEWQLYFLEITCGCWTKSYIKSKYSILCKFFINARCWLEIIPIFINVNRKYLNLGLLRGESNSKNMKSTILTILLLYDSFTSLNHSATLSKVRIRQVIKGRTLARLEIELHYSFWWIYCS